MAKRLDEFIPTMGKWLSLSWAEEWERKLFLKLQNTFPVGMMKASNWQMEKVQEFAIVPGSGGNFLAGAHMPGAEVSGSGVLDYYECRYAENFGMYFIDLGYYQLELISKKVLVGNLINIFGDETAYVIATESAESFYVTK